MKFEKYNQYSITPRIKGAKNVPIEENCKFKSSIEEKKPPNPLIFRKLTPKIKTLVNL